MNRNQQHQVWPAML